MDAASAWLDYVSPVVACAALVVSVLALLVSRAAYREGRPGVVVEATGAVWNLPEVFEGDDAHGGSRPLTAVVEVEVRNRYGGSVEVDRIRLHAPAVGHLPPVVTLGLLGDSRGEELPYELGERRARTWRFDLLPHIRRPRVRHRHGGWIAPLMRVAAEMTGFRVSIELGNGRTVRAPVQNLSVGDVDRLYAWDDEPYGATR